MGSSPIQVAINRFCNSESDYASVAQSVEQGTENPRVDGSIPSGGTIICGCSSSGRAPPCQGGGSEFEPRNPLHFFSAMYVVSAGADIWLLLAEKKRPRRYSQVVRQGTATP